MTTPIAVLNVLAAKADRVLAARALAMIPATTVALATEKEQHRVISELERRAGRVRTSRAEVERIVAALGMEWHGSR